MRSLAKVLMHSLHLMRAALDAPAGTLGGGLALTPGEEGLLDGDAVRGAALGISVLGCDLKGVGELGQVLDLVVTAG